MGATSGIGLYGPCGYSKKLLPKRSARQGLTPPAAANLVPMQTRREQVAQDPGPERTELGCVCVCSRGVRRAANRGLSLGEGVLAKASAVRPLATPSHERETHTRTTGRHRTHSARCPARPHAVTRVFVHSCIRTFIHSYNHERH